MEIYKAINAIQSELNKTGITKDHKNKEQGYSFRGIDDVYNALSPLLAKHGVCILPRVLARTVSERASRNGGALFSVVVEAEFDFVSSSDDSSHTVKTFGEAMDSGDKATNKALSAAYKYACLQAFAIPTSGDNDIDANSPEVEAALASHQEKKPYIPSDAPKRTTEAAAQPTGEVEYVTFVPTDVQMVDGKGAGAGKVFSEIYNGRTKYSGDEMQGQLALSALTAKKEINVGFVRKGNYLNIKRGCVKMAGAVVEEDQAPF